MTATPTDALVPLTRTPLFDHHVAAGAKMVPFAGYEMPVQYPMGVLKEHLWTREKAGLFDVSHMGQAYLVSADKKHETAAAFLERFVPADMIGLGPRQQRYTQLLNEDGGIIDDLMVTALDPARHPGVLMLVVNASRKDVDFAILAAAADQTKSIRLVPNRQYALIALQGPAANAVLTAMAPAAAAIPFMHGERIDIGGIAAHVSRSGYTGEDGFEISVLASDVADLWSRLAADDRVQPIGLGARDSLRLEAGLSLYGHELDETTSPIEAGLAWSIQKRRRSDGGFPGADRIRRELSDGPRRKRVGIQPEGRAPARDGTEILSENGDKIGVVTSGGFGPSVGGPIAMGYVAAQHASPGTPLNLMVRGKPLPARVVALPFIPHRFRRQPDAS
ncbi:MAG: glycine cleavage system aminomethyltransferase GcvT [Hyphomicrobiaceae bacterium]|nr:glycine cleavage system aminomethyltransferase GcvT [Hyphomicrobiaceae bacterium]